MTLSKSLILLAFIALVIALPPSAVLIEGQSKTALFPIIGKGKYGYIDISGRVVIAPRYDIAKPFSEGLARVKLNGKWGFIDDKGLIVIRPQFDMDGAEPSGFSLESNNRSLDFHEGRAAVSFNQGRDWGYIDRTGQVVVPPIYSGVSAFSEGIAYVFKTVVAKPGSGAQDIRELLHIDKMGHILNLPLGESFSEGLSLVMGSGVNGNSADNQDPPGYEKRGYVDKAGRMIIGPRGWLDAYAFSEGLARVQGEHWGYIDKSGKEVIQWGHIDRREREALEWYTTDDSAGGVIKFHFKEAGDFHEGLARVKIDNPDLDHQAGFIDKSGGVVIKPIFIMVGNFSEGLAAACSGDDEASFVCGYIDRTAAWVVKPEQLIFAADFKNGLAWVSSLKSCGYKNKAGNYVWSADETEMKIVKEQTTMTGCSMLSTKGYEGEYNDPCRLQLFSASTTNAGRTEVSPQRIFQ